MDWRADAAKYCVYKHTSPGGKVYIGITKRNPIVRWESGKGYRHNDHMTYAIQKYGWENFQHEILMSGLSALEAEVMEKLLIAQYKSNDRRYGYNITSGGDFSNEISEETRKKISAAHKGRHVSDETRAKISAANKGRKLTDEQRENLSKVLTGRKLPQSQIDKQIDRFRRLGHPMLGKKHTETAKEKMSVGHSGSKNANWGKHLPEEVRRKISKSNTGKTHAEESRKKMSASHKGLQCGKDNPMYGRHFSDESKEKLRNSLINSSLNKVPVVQFEKSGEFVRKYPSIKAAAEACGIDGSHIGSVCSGARKSTGGYVWKYDVGRA